MGKKKQKKIRPVRLTEQQQEMLNQAFSTAQVEAAAKREVNTSLQGTPLPTGTISSGRETVDRVDDFRGAWNTMTARQDGTAATNRINIDDLSLLPPYKILEYLIDLSPEISNGLWYFLLMCNPGYSVKVMNLRNDGPNIAGKKIADGFIARLKDLYGSEDVVFSSMFLSVFMRGGVLSEVVLDSEGRTFIDLATPDPITLAATRLEDPQRGRIWKYGQWRDGILRYFQRATVRYVPLHRLPGAAFGRPIGTSAIFVALFIMGTLRDLRRVIQ